MAEILDGGMNGAKIVIESPNVVCPKCGSKFFEQVLVLKKVSGLYSGSSSESIAPIPVYRCTECHTVPAEYAENKNYKYILGEAAPEKKEKSSLIV